jgi:two-component system NtrC family sensor kinase
VKALQGHISVHDAPGGGALFRVVLPAASPADAPTPQAAAAASSVAADRRRRVLIIDDDVLVARALTARFSGGPFEVRTVHDGRLGLELVLSDDALDLVYCDLMMNGFSGVDVHEALRRRSPDRASKVVFMSGGAFTSEARTFLTDRPDAFVQKPFDILEDARRRLAPG